MIKLYGSLRKNSTDDFNVGNEGLMYFEEY